MNRIQNILSYVFRVSRSTKRFFPSSHYAVLSLFFFAGLETVFALQRFFLLLIGILIGVLIAGIAFIRAEETHGFHPTQMVLPTLAGVGLTMFSLFLPSSFMLHLYFAAAAFIFFYVLKHGARQAYPTWNWIISLIILFVSLASLLGWRFHFYIPPVFVIAGSFIVIGLMAYQSLRRLAPSRSDGLLHSLAIAFVLAEVTWALQFLPLYFIVAAGVVVALYYVAFQLTVAHYEGAVTRREVVEYAVVGTIALLILFITARWT